MPEKRALKIKIARLFYRDGMARTEIGRKLRISRFKVAQYLDEALEEGLVEIRIRENTSSAGHIESRLEKMFGLKQARIAETSADYDRTRKDIGRAAASLLNELIRSRDIIGVAWGTTLFEMLNSLVPDSRVKNISVVQLTGGLHQIEKDYSPVELTRRMAGLFRARMHQLYVPAIVDKQETLKVLLQESIIHRTVGMFTKVDLALVGIGSVHPRPSTMLYRDGFITGRDVESIVRSGAVGDINSCFYDISGRRCHTDLDGRIIGMDLSQLSGIRYSMGVAGGRGKARAILGALRGGIVNIIVTDRKTAEDILRIGGRR